MQYDSTGFSQEAFEKLTQTTSFELDKLAAKWKNFKVSVGEAFAPTATLVLNTLIDTAETMKTIIALVPDMGDAVADAMKSMNIPMSDLVRTLDALERVGLIKGKEGVFTPLKMGAEGKLVPRAEETSKLIFEGKQTGRQLPSLEKRRLASESFREFTEDEKQRRLFEIHQTRIRSRKRQGKT
ncbi:hypothetical protein LCGC14_0727000, partial [marine sediment metagenome]